MLPDLAARGASATRAVHALVRCAPGRRRRGSLDCGTTELGGRQRECLLHGGGDARLLHALEQRVEFVGQGIRVTASAPTNARYSSMEINTAQGWSCLVMATRPSLATRSRTRPKLFFASLAETCGASASLPRRERARRSTAGMAANSFVSRPRLLYRNWAKIAELVKRLHLDRRCQCGCVHHCRAESPRRPRVCARSAPAMSPRYVGRSGPGSARSETVDTAASRPARVSGFDVACSSTSRSAHAALPETMRR